MPRDSSLEVRCAEVIKQNSKEDALGGKLMKNAKNGKSVAGVRICELTKIVTVDLSELLKLV